MKREVQVDECQSCAGYWLDYGELGEIRYQYDTDAERKQSARLLHALETG